jgi:hypothetical protein
MNMKTYHIRFKLDNAWTTMERQGADMESCLAEVKQALKAQFGNRLGGFMICGPQSDGIYNF